MNHIINQNDYYKNGDIHVIGNNKNEKVISHDKFNSIVLCDGSDLIFDNSEQIFITNDIISYNNLNSNDSNYNFISKICHVEKTFTYDDNNSTLRGNLKIQNNVILGIINKNFSVNNYNLILNNGTVFLTGDIIIKKYSILKLSLKCSNILFINSSSENILLKQISSYPTSLNKSQIMNSLNSIYYNELNQFNLTDNNDNDSNDNSKILFDTLSVQNNGQLLFDTYLPNYSQSNRINTTILILAENILVSPLGKILANNIISHPSTKLSIMTMNGSYVRTSLYPSDGASSNGENGGTGGGNAGKGTAAYFNLNFGEEQGKEYGDAFLLCLYDNNIIN